jgi:hypothetical protein
VELARSALTVDPGTVHCVDAYVHNSGTEPCAVVMEISGPPKPWAWVIPESCQVEPGGKATVGLVFKPPCASDPPAGRHEFHVRASCGDCGEAASAAGTMEILPFSQVVAALDPVLARGQRSFNYTVKLANEGNVGMRATLTVDAPPRELALDVHPTEVSAGPGETATATVEVAARKRLRKGEQRYPICVRADLDGGKQVRADGAFYQLGKRE